MILRVANPFSTDRVVMGITIPAHTEKDICNAPDDSGSFVKALRKSGYIVKYIPGEMPTEADKVEDTDSINVTTDKKAVNDASVIDAPLSPAQIPDSATPIADEVLTDVFDKASTEGAAQDSTEVKSEAPENVTEENKVNVKAANKPSAPKKTNQTKKFVSKIEDSAKAEA